MSFKKQKIYLIFIALIAALAVVGCGSAGAGTDATAPTVTLTSPFDGVSDVAINANITAAFSVAMDPETITAATFALKQGASAVTGTVSYDGSRATFNPAANLAAATEYTATITTGATDLAGTKLAANKTWTFTTGTTADFSEPTVTSTSPVNNATGVAINNNIAATFSEAMDPTTIVAANFTLAEAGTPVSGTVTYDIGNKSAVLAPDANLNASTTYTATVTTNVTDSTGNAMKSAKVWTFTTAADGLGPAPVNLGTAGNYAILAKAAISTVPASDITGNVGISPAAQTYITGFSQTDATGYSTSPQVTGYIYAADMAPPTPANLTTAVSDMEAAFTDAAGRPDPDYTNLGSGNIGGETLVPGLYTWGSSVTVPSDVTISGGANDVWIFQITNNLSVSADVRVLLTGDARVRNIFWQVAGEATLGAGSHFEGNILSQTAITLGTGGSMNGRALAQTRVDLDQNTLVEPAP